MCAAFGLTVSEAKTEIMCLRTKGMSESTATFSVEAAGQVYNQTNKFVYLGGNVNHNGDPSIEVGRRIRSASCSFRKYTLELYDRPSVISLRRVPHLWWSLGRMGLTRKRWCCAGSWLRRLDMNTCQTSIKTEILLMYLYPHHW